MSAAAIAMLIAQYGIPLAQQIWTTIDSHVKEKGDPTPEMWDTLKKLVSNTIEERLKAN